MIRITKEEGHYTIKLVDKLPKRGNANWLYAIKDEPIKKGYVWTLDNEYKTIYIGGSEEAGGFTFLEEGTNVTITGTGTVSDPFIVSSTKFTPTDLPTDYGVTLSTVATTNNYSDLDNLPVVPTPLLQQIINPLDAYFGNRLTPISANEGFYVNSANNKATGVLVNNTNTGNVALSGFRATVGSNPFEKAVYIGIQGANYYAPWLRQHGLIISENLNIMTNNNTGSIVFSLGNTATTQLTEGQQDKVLRLNTDRTIVAPSLTTALIDAESTGRVLTTREWIEAQGYSPGTTDYVSNVSLVGTNLTFTGIGSAFNSTVDLSSLSGGASQSWEDTIIIGDTVQSTDNSVSYKLFRDSNGIFFDLFDTVGGSDFYIEQYDGANPGFIFTGAVDDTSGYFTVTTGGNITHSANNGSVDLKAQSIYAAESLKRSSRLFMDIDDAILSTNDPNTNKGGGLEIIGTSDRVRLYRKSSSGRSHQFELQNPTAGGITTVVLPALNVAATTKYIPLFFTDGSTTIEASNNGTVNLSTLSIGGGDDVSTFAEKSGTLIGTDRLVGLSGATDFNETISGIPLSIFNNDSGWTSNTGDALTVNPLSQFAATTSLQLAGIISDETGSGSLVFAISPTLVTPALGVATATSINGVALTTAGSATNFLNEQGNYVTVAAGSTTFIGNTDTPSSYAAQAGKFTRVGLGETGLEFTYAFDVYDDSPIKPIFWAGTQAEHDAKFGGAYVHPDTDFIIITDGTSPTLTASDITNVPSGNLVATDAQAALNELQTKIDNGGFILSSQTVGGINGDSVYLSGADTWAQTDASVEATSKSMIGIRISATEVLTHGIYTTTGLTAGSTYYLSETAGAITVTPPSTSLSVVRVLGYALSTTKLFVNTDQSYFENA